MKSEIENSYVSVAASGQMNRARATIFNQFSVLIISGVLLILFSNNSFSQKLQLNDLGYFETRE